MVGQESVRHGLAHPGRGKGGQQAGGAKECQPQAASPMPQCEASSKQGCCQQQHRVAGKPSQHHHAPKLVDTAILALKSD